MTSVFPPHGPTVTEIHFHAGEPLRFKADFEVAPTFELGEYRGVVVITPTPKSPTARSPRGSMKSASRRPST